MTFNISPIIITPYKFICFALQNVNVTLNRCLTAYVQVLHTTFIITGCCIIIAGLCYILSSVYRYRTGGYGYVFIAQDIKTGEDFALKVCSNPHTHICTCMRSPIGVSLSLKGSYRHYTSLQLCNNCVINPVSKY